MRLIQFIILVCIVILPALTRAGAYDNPALYIAPTGITYSKDEIFSPAIHITSVINSLVQVSGELHFPKDKLQVVSIISSSLISGWQERPYFSNSEGVIRFSGEMDGFSGYGGKIMTINLRGVATGNATIDWREAVVFDSARHSYRANVESASFVIGDLAGIPTASYASSVSLMIIILFVVAMASFGISRIVFRTVNI